MQINITKRDGTKEPFNADRINKSIERACAGLDDPVGKVVQIASETSVMLYDGITTEEMDNATINAALQNVQEDVVYDKIATRILLKTVYKRVLGDLSDDPIALSAKHGEGFISFIRSQTEAGLLDSRMASKFDLERLARELKPERDELFKYAGLSTLLDRYALKDNRQKAIETPQYFFMRVAMGLSYNEADPTAQAMKFYNKMSTLEYIAGGSTNIGAGTVRPALSNCFLLEIHDDIDHIAKSVADVIKISKATGGIGASLTKLRASGSPLSSNNSVSSGPTPFAKIIDTAIRAIQRGGKKKGALCFYMENWHIDFPDFLQWRHNAGDDYLRMRTADTAVWLSDEFMKRAADGRDWYMFDPKETSDLNELYGDDFSRRYNHYIEEAEAGRMRVFKKVRAEDQFRQILVSLESTSHPWLTWKDSVNLRALNNNTGTIHMSNLCTEICLPQDKDNIAVCNLASLNLARHISDGAVNWRQLEETVRLSVRHLDNLIDINILPIPEAIKSDQENRAIGLGVMGFAEAVELLQFPYDDEKSYELADMIFEFISYMAIDESANLARERGSYRHFTGSGWSKGQVPYDTIDRLARTRENLLMSRTSHARDLGLDWDALRRKVAGGMRNATLMAVAPNANIGLVAGTTPGIDPRFAQVFSRNKISGKYLDINHNLVNELKSMGLWDGIKKELIERQGDISDIAGIPAEVKAKYKSAFTVPPSAFIEIAARAQKWVDQALSRNMYLETRAIEDLIEIYTSAWQKGLKTTYYLHMKPRHTAEQSTTTVNKREQLGKVGFGGLKSGLAATVPLTEAVAPSAAAAAPAEAPHPAPAQPAWTEAVIQQPPLTEPPEVHALAIQSIATLPAETINPPIHNESIAAVVTPPAAVQPAPTLNAAERFAESCPIDPQERLLCDSCQ